MHSRYTLGFRSIPFISRATRGHLPCVCLVSYHGAHSTVHAYILFVPHVNAKILFSSRLVMICTIHIRLLQAFALFYSVAAFCYYPDGSTAKQDAPCSSTGNSTCCGSQYACLSNNICASVDTTDDPTDSTGYVRGSCTDKSWTAGACPMFCKDGQ